MSRPKTDEPLIIEHAAPPAELIESQQRNEQLPLGEQLPLDEQLSLDEQIPIDEQFPLETASAPEEVEQENPRLDEGRLRSVLESLLLVSDRPLSVARIVELLHEAAGPAAHDGPPLYQPMEVQAALSLIAAEYLTGKRGIELNQIAGGWQLRTAPDNAAWVQRLLQQKPTRLARAQLETLAIVAYRQPITRPEIDDVRGVDSGGALKTLLERRLVRVLGKKEEPGRPLLYGTTREFLEFFNLRDLKDLPTLREYYDLNDENKAKVQAAHGDAPVQPELIPAEPPPIEPPPPSLEGAISRVEIAAQHLADDAEQLAKIDELISSVPTDFPLLDAVLNPPPPAAPTASAATPASPDDEAADSAPRDIEEL